MVQMVSVFALFACYFSSCEALFFGLFNPKQTSKPDLVISETKGANTDKAAYEQYLRAIEQINPLHTEVRYVSFIYPEYVKQYLIYHPSQLKNDQHETASVQVKYPQEQTYSSSYIQRPIVVLPSESFQPSFESISEKTRDLSNLINSNAAVKYVVPEAQLTTTLYDLPIPIIAPDFNTEGYV